MSSLKYIFLFLFFTLVLSQNETNTSQPSNSTKDEIPINDDDIEESNETLSNTSTHKRPEFDKYRPFNLSYDEMDTMIFCTFVIQDTLREKKSELEKMQKRLNLSTPNLVNKFVINLTYFDNFKMDKSYKSLAEVDFDKYNNISDLALTMEQQILMYKYQSVEEIFRQKRADQRDTVDNTNANKIKIGNFDIDNIPSPVKFGSLLIVLILIFGGIFYFLKKLEKKPKDKKKNKKKKTQ